MEAAEGRTQTEILDLSTKFVYVNDHRYMVGIVYANERFYLADQRESRVYAYRPNGEVDPTAGFDLVGVNYQPRAVGITYANGRLFVLDYVDEKVYAYHVDGQLDEGASFDVIVGTEAGISRESPTQMAGSTSSTDRT